MSFAWTCVRCLRRNVSAREAGDGRVFVCECGMQVVSLAIGGTYLGPGFRTFPVEYVEAGC